MAAKRLSASSADMLMNCPGSANLEHAIPGWTPPTIDDTKWKTRSAGTAMHSIIDGLFKLVKEAGYPHSPDTELYATVIERLSKIRNPKRDVLLNDSAEFLELVDETFHTTAFATWAPSAQTLAVFGLTLRPALIGLTPKQMRFLLRVIKHVLTVLAEIELSNDLVTMFNEKELVTGWLSKPGTTTPDWMIFNWTTETLRIVDFKMGTVPVHAESNPQLMFYAVSGMHYMEKVQEVLLDDSIQHIQLEIWQDRGEGEPMIDRWEPRLSTIETFKKRALRAEQDIQKGWLKLVPGDHCTFCPANPFARGEKGYPSCPARMEQLYGDSTDEFEVLTMTEE